MRWKLVGFSGPKAVWLNKSHIARRRTTFKETARARQRCAARQFILRNG